MRLLTRFAEKPAQSIPGVSHGWSEMMAAYRFVGNDAFEWHDIMQPHWNCTRERMREHAVVLCIQDTAELDFNGQEIGDLGLLNHKARRGGMCIRRTRSVRIAWGWACWMPGCRRAS
ncbi:hypothetical protein R69658_07686 [Paraburkholderia aspalathi]|uniref:Transposase Tn5-like N-terminal domain-containing protein n=1 Tax=Paraburkholderia aspalathi TaxID=1324617 RepID=A0ABM8T6S5_9BURK|nr:transposase DNA-binding-containing protein [Paraburkholderia aspalathi]CAE6862457.1 hypothetical protein R69658_07686 [Paraburkholderia aspalathi]CAE6874492.1 hypothetical protein R69746_08676 [Paraburkholderia aspalathi]CAE6874886.1 hypothetical protein R75465_08541 [Paraburkholderia aspalathi]